MIPASISSPLIPQLHIPDGFLSTAVSLVFWLLTIVFVTIAARRIQADYEERLTPLMGILAAFIFAAQMINFPVAGGTSGHLLGGALAAIVLGPWAAMLVMTAVIAAQAILFQDGGLLVMGANIFNMGILTVLIGFGLYRSVSGRGRRTKMLVVAAAAWLSVMAGALSTSLQLWLSGTSTLTFVMPAMLGIHAIIGIGEALITVGALAFIMQTRPDFLSDEAVTAKGGRLWIAVGAVITLLVVILAPFASANPDGLERVAEDLGFINTGVDAPYQLLPDYTIPLLGGSALSTVVAGIIGALFVSVLVYLLARTLRKAPPADQTVTAD